MSSLYNFIVHYKDGSRLVTLFETFEEVLAHALAYAEAEKTTPDISVAYCSFGLDDENGMYDNR